MKKKIIFALLMMIVGLAFADESSNFSALQRQLDYCSTLKSNRQNVTARPKCIKDAWLNLASQTNLNSLKSGSSNIIFVLQQLINLIEDSAKNPNYSRSDFEDKSSKLIDLYDTEMERMTFNLRSEITEINVAEANRRTNTFIANLVTILGGLSARSDSNQTTYIINGRSITCRTTGAFTNCF